MTLRKLVCVVYLHFCLLDNNNNNKKKKANTSLLRCLLRVWISVSSIHPACVDLPIYKMKKNGREKRKKKEEKKKRTTTTTTTKKVSFTRRQGNDLVKKKEEEEKKKVFYFSSSFSGTRTDTSLRNIFFFFLRLSFIEAHPALSMTDNSDCTRRIR